MTDFSLRSGPISVKINHYQIYKIAVAAGGQEYLDQGYTAAAALTRYPLDETMPTWYVNYQDAGYSVDFTVVIDARSGEIIHAVATQ